MEGGVGEGGACVGKRENTSCSERMAEAIDDSYDLAF